MRAASSGVRPPSSASGTSAQPSGTNTTYFIGDGCVGGARGPSLALDAQARCVVARARCCARASARAAAARRERRRRRPRRRRPRRPTTTTADDRGDDPDARRDRRTDAAISRRCSVRLDAGRHRAVEPGRDRVPAGRDRIGRDHVRRRAGRNAAPDRRTGARRRHRARPRATTSVTATSRACSARVLARRQAPLRRLHRRATATRNVDEYTMHGDDADASTAPARALRRPAVLRTTTAARWSSGPTAMLYIGLGDGGSAGDPHDNGQNLGDPARQDPAHRPDARRATRRTAFPPTTRSSDAPGAFAEIWMYGLRNPWRFSFDRATGDLWIGDVGQDDVRGDRLRAARASTGINWGWSQREGNHEFKGAPARRRARPDRRDLARRRLAARSSAATCTAVARFPRSTARTCSATTADRTSTASCSAAARRSRSATSASPSTQLTTFGEDPTASSTLAARGGTVYRLVATGRQARATRPSA